MNHLLRSKTRAGAAGCFAVALLSLTACGSSDTGNDTKAADSAASPSASGSAVPGLYDKLPKAIKDKGHIDNIVVNNYPPFEFVDAGSSDLKGIDIDLAKRLSEVIGIPIKFSATSEFTQLVPSVQTGRADMGMSGTLDKPERQSSVDFVDYFKTGNEFLVPESSNLTDYASLCGKTVVTGSGTSYPDEIAKISDESCAGAAPIKVLSIQPVLQVMLKQVEIGRAQAAYWATDSSNYELASMSKKYKILDEPIFTGKLYGASINKDLPELRDVVQQGLQAMVADGSYAKILEKWGQNVGAMDEITVNKGAA
jgi:polar amino acid transport system substrate-binding protein